MAIPESEFEPPSLEELEARALDYYKACKPKAYRQMKKDGDLQEVCQMKARAAKRYAENLIATGEFPGPAWNMAIRSEILESETD